MKGTNPKLARNLNSKSPKQLLDNVRIIKMDKEKIRLSTDLNNKVLINLN